MNNEEVAKRFVLHKQGTGSNFRSSPDDRRSLLISYSTTVAVLHKPVAGHPTQYLFVTDRKYSSSTDRQLSYLRRAWGYENPVYYVSDVTNGGGWHNVSVALTRATDALMELCKPRIRMTTRQAKWDTYLREMDLADSLLALPPHVTNHPPSQELRTTIYDKANAARAGNPTGLGGFDEDLLLRVKAICALEE